ncbi:hypothetical protein [Allomesorhizobium camelthorni]|uniref:Uncharacterized protein n=1 Tax=Allomesorhizobium camelthorni TaxID=475069 RepID=A0A6G4WM69_9HYPH|nr:hypothetical protein [Mesorhizobium camelthorni]NGO55167.1 hypothetical protein [Mesorhizobium camelthorni]
MEELRDRVACGAVLESDGREIDKKESTRPRSEAKTDVFTLAEHLGARGFPAAADHVASLVGFVTTAHIWQKRARAPSATSAAADRWTSWERRRAFTHTTLPVTICSAEGQLVVPRLAAP